MGNASLAGQFHERDACQAELLLGFHGCDPAFIEQPQHRRLQKILAEPLFGVRIQRSFGNRYFDLNFHSLLIIQL